MFSLSVTRVLNIFVLLYAVINQLSHCDLNHFLKTFVNLLVNSATILTKYKLRLVDDVNLTLMP